MEIIRGSGGVSVVKPLDGITFPDVYNEVECVTDRTLFHFYENE